MALIQTSSDFQTFFFFYLAFSSFLAPKNLSLYANYRPLRLSETDEKGCARGSGREQVQLCICVVTGPTGQQKRL